MTRQEMVDKLRDLYGSQLPSDAVYVERYWTDERFAVKFDHPQWRVSYWLCGEVSGTACHTAGKFSSAKKWVYNEYRDWDGDSPR